MGAPPKCRLLPSVRAARASSDPVAHSAPRPRPAACAWCEEPPERGLPHCDDRTTWPRSVVPRTGLGPPVDGAVCAQARLHAQCARRLCQCTRNARAVHAHFTRSADALSTKPHTSGVTRRPCAWHTAHPAPPPCPPTPRRPARAAGARAPRGSLARRGSGQARGGVASVRCRGAGRRGGGGAPGADAAAAGRGGQEDLLTPHLLGERGAAGRTRSLTLTLTLTRGRRVQPMF